MSDEYVLQASHDLGEPNRFEVINRHVIQVNDNKGGNYNSG